MLYLHLEVKGLYSICVEVKGLCFIWCKPFIIIIGAQPVLRSSMFYGEGTGDIRLSELDCNGTERNLLECPPARQQGSDVRMCSHFEDAGVRCDGKCWIGQCMGWMLLVELRITCAPSIDMCWTSPP